MIGRILKNRYKLIDERGNGSMATVYIGRDLETNRLHAVKVLSRQAAAESELVERFKREFEMLTRLTGPHVVSPVDFGEDKGTLFIVMDYVDGHNLKHLVLTGGAFTILRALDVAEQATSGIASADASRIVHRDVKPQNLLLSVDNVVKLTDFGLARSHESGQPDLTATGFFVGTPFYVAPEQVENGKNVDVRADLYSLACVFFELLTARVPYDGDHAWDVVLRHLNAPIPSARALRRELPAEFDAFFARALAKAPADRYQTPRAFVDALEALPRPERRATDTHPDVIGALVAPNGMVMMLSAPDVMVGRSDPQRGFTPDIDLLPLDAAQTVSRKHARFTRRDNQFFVEDMKAFNRTYVNSASLVPYQDVELQHGDIVRLGNVELRFELRAR